MVPPTLRFTSFETRRWVVACALAAALLTLQVLHAAGVTGNAAAPDAVPIAAPRTATPAVLVTVAGTVVAVSDELLGVRETEGTQPVSFSIDADTHVTRDGNADAPSSLRPGDSVSMTVDGGTGRILQLRADPAPAGWRERFAAVGPVAALALVVAAALLVARVRGIGPLTAPLAFLRLTSSLRGWSSAAGGTSAVRRRHRACRA